MHFLFPRSSTKHTTHKTKPKHLLLHPSRYLTLKMSMIEQQPQLVNVKTVPMSQVIRPIAPVLDQDKVQCLMESIDREGLHVPIQVLQDTDTGLMFSFGGCHRFEAHRRLDRETVLVEVRSATPTMLKLYLGASYQTIVNNYLKSQKEDNESSSVETN